MKSYNLKHKQSHVLDGLEKAVMEQHPFLHTKIYNFFSPEVATVLNEKWPRAYFKKSSSEKGHYHLWDRTLVDKHEIIQIDDLTPEWQELVRSFLSEEYKRIVEKLIGERLDGGLLKIRLCEYHNDCWMLPHTDRKDRIVTQVLYLTKGWEREWGGNLFLLGSENESDIIDTFTPKFNSSFLFRRADHSWHAVQAVKPDVEVVRKTILVQFIQS